MSSFGQWLGESNGDTMLAEIFNLSVTAEQARAGLTTYCLLYDIEVDTLKWDNTIHWLYKNYDSWFDTERDFDDFMCELLV